MDDGRGQAAATPPCGTYGQLLRTPVALRLLLASVLGNVANFLGFGILYVLAYERAGGMSIGPGLTMLAMSAPAVLGGTFLGGVLAPLDRRRTLRLLHLLGATAPPVALLPGLVPVLVASAALSLASATIILVRTPAMAESVPERVQGPLLGALGTSANLAVIVGLGFGSSLTIALGGPTLPLLLTSASFVGGAAVVHLTPLATPERGAARPGPLAGFTAIFGDPVLRALFFLVVVLVAVAAIPETLATAVSDVDWQVGLLMASAPAATVLASLWTGRREDLLLDPRFLLAQIALAVPGAAVVVVLGPGLGATLAANLVLGLAIGWTVGAQLIFMRRVPPHLLGQVTGTMVAFTVTTEGLGGLAVGAVADATTVQGGYLFVAALVIVGVATLGPGVLRARRHGDAVEPEVAAVA